MQTALVKCHLPGTLSKLSQCTGISQQSLVSNLSSKIAKFCPVTKFHKVTAGTQETSVAATKQSMTSLKFVVKTSKPG